LAYPILVVAVALIVLAVLLIYIIPTFSTLYENFGAELPEITKSLIRISEIARQNSLLIILLFLFGSGFSALAFFNERVKLFWDRLIIRTPILKGLLEQIINARFARTLGTLINSGVEIVAALNVSLSTIGNRYLQRHTSSFLESIEQGNSLTVTLSRYPIFTNTLIRMTDAGEKTGDLGKLLIKAASFHEAEVDHQVGNLTTLLEPIIIVALGIFIAFILIAMYLPMFELMGGFRGN
jgi:type IV pilus assembly protein PilC